MIPFMIIAGYLAGWLLTARYLFGQMRAADIDEAVHADAFPGNLERAVRDFDKLGTLVIVFSPGSSGRW